MGSEMCIRDSSLVAKVISQVDDSESGDCCRLKDRDIQEFLEGSSFYSY